MHAYLQEWQFPFHRDRFTPLYPVVHLAQRGLYMELVALCETTLGALWNDRLVAYLGVVIPLYCTDTKASLVT